MKKVDQSGFTAIHVVLILVLLGIIGVAGWKVYDAGKASVKPAATTSPVPAAKKEAPKIPDGFVEYQNKELGFKFAYPKDWGEVQFSTHDGAEGGKSFHGTFSSKSVITFGGLSEDFREGRVYVYPETKGFLKKGDQYYEHALNDAAINDFAVVVKPITNKKTKGILLKGDGKPGLNEIYNSRLMAVFNIDNKTYPGLGFSDNDLVQVPQADFERVLNTVEQVK